MSFDLGLLIGRFQILQRGHGTLLRAALDSSQRVLVVIGSAYRARDAHNPFTWEERKQQFEAMLTPEERARVDYLPVRDYFDDDRWSAAIRKGVSRHTTAASRVTLVGFRKDQTSYYLDHFPDWALQEVEAAVDISASDLRNIYFESGNLEAALAVIENYVEPGVRDYLEAWAKLPVYRSCAAEHKAVTEYRKKYTAPFSLTADVLVRARDEVLLIRRGGNVGRDLWALPGGFIDPHERFYTAAVRELAEETSYAPAAAQLKRALRSQAVFDHPDRSSRGRIVTTAFYFDLGDVAPPEVKACDDAKLARWIPISELPALESQLFEDHACILDHFVGLFPEE